MKIHEHGAGERAVVLLHGIPGSSAVWREVAADLARDHRVLVPDLLGFGESRRPASIGELWADAQAVALAEALRAAGVARAVVAGHDFGGPVALALADAEPGRRVVAGLCLAATNAFPDTPIPLPIRAVTWPLVGAVAGRALFSRPSLAMMLSRGASVPLEGAGHLGDGAQVRATATIFGHALRELGARYASAERVLRELDVPVLVAWGERDPFFPLAQGERTAAAARDGRLVVYERARHFLPAERPRRLAADLRRLALDCLP
ncbi:MAG: alpha/beta fold hydrolase [Thermoleophilaceae bacterium]